MSFMCMCTQTLRRCRTYLAAAGQGFETLLWSYVELNTKYRLQSLDRDRLLIRISPATATAMRPVQASNLLPTTNFYVPRYALSCQSENQCPLRNCITVWVFQLHLAFKLVISETCKEHYIQDFKGFVLYHTT